MLRTTLFFLFACLAPFSLMAAAGDTSPQQTLSMIKPDGIANKHVGEIIARFEKNGLQISAAKMLHLTAEQAGQFYAVHKDRPFYKDLINMMSSGPVMVMVLEGEDAIAKNRQLMGATDPSKAAASTIRADFSRSVTENTVHGSDSVENAKLEIAFFFKPEEIVNPIK
ncbi:Nucleoside diphosphate kinase 1 [Neochlamydia sp. EPS4]|nr:Nucleoside diphosphate kinase 1 [Neochlamydia sp. EPS4]